MTQTVDTSEILGHRILILAPSADVQGPVGKHSRHLVEAIEHAYPIRLLRYSLRPKSGGAGKFCGGDGVIREIRFLSKAQVTLLSDRRYAAKTRFGFCRGIEPVDYVRHIDERYAGYAQLVPLAQAVER